MKQNKYFNKPLWIKRFTYISKKFFSLDLMTEGAALSFYTSFSLTPLILITLYLLGLWGDEAQSHFTSQITQLVGDEAGNALLVIINSIHKHTNLKKLTGFIGIITLVLSASAVFNQLLKTMNKVFGVKDYKKNNLILWIKRRSIAISIILVMAFLSISSLIASTFIKYVLALDKSIWNLVNHSLTFFLFTFVFTILIKYLPDTHVSFKNAYNGGILTSVFYHIGKYVIGLYIANSPLTSAYGAAGTLIIFLIWVYYSAIIVFTGALFTKTLEKYPR